MPLTHDQIKERFASLAKSVEKQFEQEGYSALHVAKPNFMELQLNICKELQAEYKISSKEAFFILNNITETRSSDDVFNIMKTYRLDEAGLKLTNQLEQYYSISLEDAAKEASLIEDKEKFHNSSDTVFFIKELISAPDSQYKSISEVANTLSKYKTITDKQIFELSCWRVEDIKSGKMTLDEALLNTAKYGIYGNFGKYTGTKPYSFIESVKEFFGFKNSSDSIETPAPDVKTPELVADSHHTDSNE